LLSARLADDALSRSPPASGVLRREDINSMSAHTHLLPTYLRLRKLSMSLNHKLVETLDKEIMDEGGHKLGILQKGTLVLGSEDELSVVMDYCIYNVYRGGRNAVQRMLADSPPSNPDERALLEAQSKARYSIFQVSDVESGVGVTLVDLLRKDTIFLVDVGFGKSTRKGFGLAGRVIPQDGFFMSAGAMLPFDGRAAKRAERDLERWLAKGKDFARLTAAEEADLTAQIIRACLETGASEHIRYATPGEARSPGRWSAENVGRVRANRNDPCPCGSGRKYKSCCGKR
jgi:SEC-C motif